MEILIVIDKNIIKKYNDHYFKKYPRRKKIIIDKPIFPSLNKWMVMRRFEMNAQKQAWKEFGVWLVREYGLENKKINKCKIIITYFFDNRRRHDADNYTPKYLFDSFTETKLIDDDDFDHIESLTIVGKYCKENPRTEIRLVY